MRHLLILSCILLAACGARRDAPEGGAGVGGLLQRAFASTSDEKMSVPAGGGLCGDPMLVGKAVGSVGGAGVCGVEDAVEVYSIGDVTLSQAAVINCETARTLSQWVQGAAMPTLANEGGGLASLRVAAHYVCRTRNHQRGARVSEHGKGRAIDLSAFILEDGTEITVLDHWNSRSHGQKLRAMHKAACGPFGTVLGPGSDRFHDDHLHFDTAAYRRGSYCR